MCKNKYHKHHKYCCEKKNKPLGYGDIRFEQMRGHLSLPNGFVLTVEYDEQGRLDQMYVTDGYPEYTHLVQVDALVNDARQQSEKLHHMADVMLVSNIIERIQDIPKEEVEKFYE